MNPQPATDAASPHRTQPTRALGTFDATCIVIGAIVGVGIFFTPSKVAKLTGTPALALTAWCVAGFIALCGAFAFAALGRRYQANGAQYEVLRDAFGPLPAFVFVFCNCTAVQAGATAIIALVCIDNLTACFGVASLTGSIRMQAAAGLIITLALANAAGVRFGASIQNITVVAKLGVLAWIVILGITTHQPTPAAAVTPLPTTISPLQGVLAALVPAFFSYGGWQHALWISGEVRDPAKTLPRALIAGVGIVVLIYVTANIAFFQLLGPAGVASSSSLAAESVATRFPAMGARFAAGVVAFSAFGVLNAQLLSGPRLVYGMALDGRFFPAFARLAPKFGTPWAAILLLAATALILLFAAGQDAVDRLINGVVFIDCVFFVATGAAVLLFHHRGTAKQHPLVLAAAGLFCLGEIGVLIGAYADPQARAASLIGLAWIAAAAVIFLIFFRRNRVDRAGA